MLKKINRNKTPNRIDVYKNIKIKGITKSEQIALKTSKILTNFLCDDLLVNILIQKQKFFTNRFSHSNNHKNTEIDTMFCPSFIPVECNKQGNQKTNLKLVFDKSAFYWKKNTIEHNCICCNKEMTAYLSDFSVKNLTCYECLIDTITNDKNVFFKNKIFSKVTQLDTRYYESNKLHNERVFLIASNRNMFKSNNPEKTEISQKNKVLRKITKEIIKK